MLTLTPPQMLQRAATSLANGQLQAAEQAARAVVKAVPRSFDGWLMLGRVLTSAARFTEAEEALAAADRLKPRQNQVMLARAQVQWRLGNDAKVIDLCKAVQRADAANVEAAVLSGASYRRRGKLDESLAVLRRFSSEPYAAIGMAWTLMDLKDYQAAIDVLEPFLGHPKLTAQGRRSALHAIGQAHEALGRYEEAFRRYEASRAAFATNFGEDAFRTGLALMREVFSPEAMRNAPKPTVRTSRPVFIAGMPRSGTTLLDRIIAAHPQCGGAGETRALRGQVAEWMSPDPTKAWPRIVSTFGTADFDRIATRYIAETNEFGPQAQRIADKHLQNWVYVGLAAMALPDARVIHITRDPIDIGISCFEHLDATALPWCASLRQIGMMIRGVEELMAYWKAEAPIAFLTVEYEKLVRDQAAEVRRILEFLGLPWDDACMRHHESRGTGAKPAPTLGTEQASRPVTDKSIGRGARFGALLDPLREALARPV